MGWTIDPMTVQFLESVMDPVFGFPTFIRFSWSTASRMLQEKQAAPVIWKNEVEKEPPLKRFEYEAAMQRRCGITKSEFWVVFMIQNAGLRCRFGKNTTAGRPLRCKCARNSRLSRAENDAREGKTSLWAAYNRTKRTQRSLLLEHTSKSLCTWGYQNERTLLLA